MSVIRSLFFASVFFVIFAPIASAQRVELTFETAHFNGSNLTYTTLVEIPYNERVAENYTVQVPYTENVSKEGKVVPVQKMREETRTRTLTRKRTRLERQTLTKKSSDNIVFRRLAGEEISKADLEKLLAKPRKVLVLEAGEEISDFHREVLNPKLIVMTQQKQE